MPKKLYTIEGLCCANCAAKAEAAMNRLPQVESAVITFATRQLQVTAPDPDALLPQLQAVLSSIEPDARLCTAEAQPHLTHSCSCSCCGDAHDHGHHHSEPEAENPMPILLGAVLFLLGLLLSDFSVLGIPLCLPVYLAAYLVLSREVLAAAWKSLGQGHALDEHFLMSIASIGAFFIGEFPEAVGIMLFYRVGEYFEHRAVARSRSQIMAAADLRPDTVTRLIDGKPVTIPAAQAQVGDLLLVRPGDRIPLDGVAVTGQSSLDTSAVTGESVPRAVRPGDTVISGCVNTTGQLTIRVEKPLSESMVTRILQAVENAAAGKPKIDRFITRFARVYTPVVVAVAALTAFVPSLITGHWQYWVYTALSFLVMSCPCALVLSVPLAFFAGIGQGSKKGILFKGGLSIEALAGVKNAALDKTGTLTKGDFQVQKVVGREDLLALCAACEQHSSHPIAQSITQAAHSQGLSLMQPEQLEEIPGCGIRAVLSQKSVLCGNDALFARFHVAVPALPKEAGCRVLVAENGTYIGYILLSDTLKPGTVEAIKSLQRMNIHPIMLTGDIRQNAEAVAQAAGIGEVYVQLLPQQKLETLLRLRQKRGSTLFVGDGINDAPVLAGADVGGAMGSGADAAIEAADVVFMTSDPAAIPESIIIARRTQRTARQNVVFALSVKAVVMVLGLMGFASMWLAVFADSGVAALCILNAVRQLYSRKS